MANMFTEPPNRRNDSLSGLVLSARNQSRDEIGTYVRFVNPQSVRRVPQHSFHHSVRNDADVKGIDRSPGRDLTLFAK